MSRLRMFGGLLGAAVAFCPHALATANAGDSTSTDQTLAESLWVPRADLSQAHAARLPRYCGGAYVQRAFEYPRASDSDDFPIVTLSDRVDCAGDGMVDLTGNVTFSRGNRILEADRVRYDQGTEIAEFEGEVTINEIIAAVNSALNGCALAKPPATPAPTETRQPGPTVILPATATRTPTWTPVPASATASRTATRTRTPGSPMPTQTPASPPAPQPGRV